MRRLSKAVPMRRLVFCPTKPYWWLTLLLVLCGVLAPVGMEAAGKIKLRKVYSYRLPSAPPAYWALAAGDKPWLIVASFVREEVGHVPHIDLTLVDWERGTVLASAKATHLQTAKVAAESCTESVPPHDKLVAVVRDRLVVKLCSSIQIFSLPGLARERVLLDVEPEQDLGEMLVSGDGGLLAVVMGPPAPRGWLRPRKVVLFDTETWEIKREIPVGEGERLLHRLSFSPTGRLLAVAGTILEGRVGLGDHIQVFDTTDGNLLSKFDLKPMRDEDGYHTPPYLFAGAHSQWLLSSGFVKLTSEDTTYVWDWRRGTVARTIADRRGIKRGLSGWRPI